MHTLLSFHAPSGPTARNKIVNIGHEILPFWCLTFLQSTLTCKRKFHPSFFSVVIFRNETLVRQTFSQIITCPVFHGISTFWWLLFTTCWEPWICIQCLELIWSPLGKTKDTENAFYVSTCRRVVEKRKQNIENIQKINNLLPVKIEQTLARKIWNKLFYSLNLF